MNTTGKTKTVLIVDDMAVNRAILSAMLEKEYVVLEAANGEEALEKVYRNLDSISIILLDIMMPGMDGFEVMRRLNTGGVLKTIPVIVITAANSCDVQQNAQELGAVDLITKPFDHYVVRQRINNIVELYLHKNNLESLVDRQTKELRRQTAYLTRQTHKMRQFNYMVVDALSTVIEYRNVESGQHIKRIRHLTKALLEVVARRCPEYGLTRETIETIASASAMHDIGKIAIPDSVLLKPAKLTSEEFEIIKSHPEKGCEILSTLVDVEDEAYLDCCYDICMYHHEKWDGSGYPDGLSGKEIPISAQVVSLADCYDALTSARVYKPAYSHEEAAQMIYEGKCGVFDPKLVECFTEALGSFRALSEYYADNTKSNYSRDREFIEQEIPEFSPGGAKEELKSLLSKYLHRYLEESDYSWMNNMLDDKVSWFGTKLHNICYGVTNALEIVEENMKLRKGDYHIADEWYDVQELYPMLYLAYGELSFSPIDQEEKAEIIYLRVSTICQRVGDNVRLLHLHMSVPDTDMNDEFDVGQAAQGEKRILEQTVEECTRTITRQAEEIGDIASILGSGTLTLASDNSLKIWEIGLGVTILLGYCEEELQRTYGGKYINIVAPQCRGELLIQMQKLAENPNLTADLTYDCMVKGGEVKHIYHHAKSMRGAGGEPLLRSVICDAHKVVVPIGTIEINSKLPETVKN